MIDGRSATLVTDAQLRELFRGFYNQPDWLVVHYVQDDQRIGGYILEGCKVVSGMVDCINDVYKVCLSIDDAIFQVAMSDILSVQVPRRRTSGWFHHNTFVNELHATHPTVLWKFRCLHPVRPDASQERLAA